ncbi:hypothetical protein JCM16303_002940 [Sporobolomyces ruberrimus]
MSARTNVSSLGDSISAAVASGDIGVVMAALRRVGPDRSSLDTSDSQGRLVLASPFLCRERDPHYIVAVFGLLLEAGCDPERVGADGLSVEAISNGIIEEDWRDAADWIDNELAAVKSARSRGVKYRPHQRILRWIRRELSDSIRRSLAELSPSERERFKADIRQRTTGKGTQRQESTKKPASPPSFEPTTEGFTVYDDVDDLPDYEEPTQDEPPQASRIPGSASGDECSSPSRDHLTPELSDSRRPPAVRRSPIPFPPPPVPDNFEIPFATMTGPDKFPLRLWKKPPCPLPLGLVQRSTPGSYPRYTPYHTTHFVNSVEPVEEMTRLVRGGRNRASRCERLSNILESFRAVVTEKRVGWTVLAQPFPTVKWLTRRLSCLELA